MYSYGLFSILDRIQAQFLLAYDMDLPSDIYYVLTHLFFLQFLISIISIVDDTKLVSKVG